MVALAVVSSWSRVPVGVLLSRIEGFRAVALLPSICDGLRRGDVPKTSNAVARLAFGQQTVEGRTEPFKGTSTDTLKRRSFRGKGRPEAARLNAQGFSKFSATRKSPLERVLFILEMACRTRDEVT